MVGLDQAVHDVGPRRRAAHAGDRPEALVVGQRLDRSRDQPGLTAEVVADRVGVGAGLFGHGLHRERLRTAAGQDAARRGRRGGRPSSRCAPDLVVRLCCWSLVAATLLVGPRASVDTSARHDLDCGRRSYIRMISRFVTGDKAEAESFDQRASRAHTACRLHSIIARRPAARGELAAGRVFWRLPGPRAARRSFRAFGSAPALVDCRRGSSPPTKADRDAHEQPVPV